MPNGTEPIISNERKRRAAASVGQPWVMPGVWPADGMDAENRAVASWSFALAAAPPRPPTIILPTELWHYDDPDEELWEDLP